VILALTIGESGGKKPKPTPPGPAPPVPVNTGYNLYYMDPNDQVQNLRNKMSGILRFKIPEFSRDSGVYES